MTNYILCSETESQCCHDHRLSSTRTHRFLGVSFSRGQDDLLFLKSVNKGVVNKDQ